MNSDKALENFDFELEENGFNSDIIKYHTVNKDKLYFTAPVIRSKLGQIQHENFIWLNTIENQRIVIGFKNLKNGFQNGEEILFYEAYDSTMKKWGISSSIISEANVYSAIGEALNSNYSEIENELDDLMEYLLNYFEIS